MMNRLLWSLLPVLLAVAVDGWAQPAAAPVGVGIHAETAPAVLDDPDARRCFSLTGPRPGMTPPAVDEAAMLLNVSTIFDAVASCRAGLAKFPLDRRLIIAEDHVGGMVSTLVAGLETAGSDQAAFAKVLAASATPDSRTGFDAKVTGFFLGSAYEYGIGTKPDRAAAMEWYAVGAKAGEPIAQRELARLREATP